MCNRTRKAARAAPPHPKFRVLSDTSLYGTVSKAPAARHSRRSRSRQGTAQAALPAVASGSGGEMPTTAKPQATQKRAGLPYLRQFQQRHVSNFCSGLKYIIITIHHVSLPHNNTVHQIVVEKAKGSFFFTAGKAKRAAGIVQSWTTACASRMDQF
jgi:hypothetical protein